MGRRRGKLGYAAVKRALDIVLSALGLALCLLPLALACLAILLTDGGPALFSQERVGRFGEPFRMYKLRTLKKSVSPHFPSQEVDERTTTSQEVDERTACTAVGRFLRRSSVDELPQLWNVLRGDMSLVGPRPLIPEETEVHELRRKLGVYAVRPGMTGLAQINGRDELQGERKAALDAQYVRSMSLKNDFLILLRTLPTALRG